MIAYELSAPITHAQTLSHTHTTTQQILSTIWASCNATHAAFAKAHLTDLCASLASTQMASTGASKKNRLRMLCLLVPQLSGQNLELIPAVVPEAILATKEVNEKTRNLAYKCVAGAAQFLPVMYRTQALPVPLLWDCCNAWNNAQALPVSTHPLFAACMLTQT